jgi:hypothetical protein
MTAEEKLEKASREFCSLSEEKQEYILGVLEALVFAKDEIVNGRPGEVDTNKSEGVLT